MQSGNCTVSKESRQYEKVSNIAKSKPDIYIYFAKRYNLPKWGTETTKYYKFLKGRTMPSSFLLHTMTSNKYYILENSFILWGQLFLSDYMYMLISIAEQKNHNLVLG